MSDALNQLLSDINFSEKKVTKVQIEEVSGDDSENAPTLVVIEGSSETKEPEPIKGKLCLNMIVKNESRIITRLLESVLNIIDTYCICDTGSTDETAAVITEFMKLKGKPGEVYKEPFKNFGYNRTHSLERAARWGEYALLLDADMRLVIQPEFTKDDLKHNGYSIIQKNGSIEYYNTRIVKTGIGVKCVGPTHEYYDFPGGDSGHKLPTLYIDDIGDGGAKADKFERDIRLLHQGLEEEPRNERYHFYLANSYNHVGKYREAIEWYKKRVDLGGWIEEVFYACFELGNMYHKVGEIGNAVYWWMEAYNRHPKRSESLYELTKYYREVGKQRIAQMYCDLGSSIPFPKDDLLFIKTACYDFLFDYENSILAYYTQKPVDHMRYLRLIGKNYCKDNCLSNYKFYVKKLKNFCVRDIDFCGKAVKTIMGRDDDFISSSPCIIPHSEGYLMNVRYVNYYIEPSGAYKFKHSDGKITTLNKVVWLNKKLQVVRESWIDKVQNEHLRYQGVEDVKVFSHCGELLFLGTVEDPENGRVSVGHGIYEPKSNILASTPFKSPNDRGCEKNWCYVHNTDGQLRVIYDWSPLTIGEVDNGALKILSKSADVPEFFRDIRGSSNGCVVGDEVWFLCHLVQYSTPRWYYHILVVLDKDLKYKRHSTLFKFHDDCIEYALGLIVEPERLLISYSRMDRTSAVIEVARDVVDRELFSNKQTWGIGSRDWN